MSSTPVTPVATTEPDVAAERRGAVAGSAGRSARAPRADGAGDGRADDTPSRAATIGAWTWALSCFAITGVGMFFQYLDRHTFVPVDFGSRTSIVVSGIVFLALPPVGALVAARRPRNPLGWLFIAIGFSMAAYILLDGYAIYATRVKLPAPRGGHVAAWLATWNWIPGWGMTAFVFLLFPTGRLPSRRWRPVAWAVAAVTVLAFVGLAFERGPLANYTFLFNPYGRFLIGSDSHWVKLRGVALLGIVGLLCIASLFVRLRSARGDERQQLKWLTYAGALPVVTVVVWTILYPLNYDSQRAQSLSLLVGIVVPIAAGVAVLKYRLYDIDVVINRTVVYGVMAAFLTAVYVAVVVGIGTLIGARQHSDVGLSIVATAIVAVAFQPVRERAQRLANRLVYGRRAEPYEVLSEFAERVAGSYSTEDVLPRMARMLIEGTGAARAEIWLRVGDELRPAASWPERDGPSAAPIALPADGDVPFAGDARRVFPVRHQGELLGVVFVEMTRGESLNSAQERLLQGLASQGGLVLRNVRLTAELRARLEEISRQAAELEATARELRASRMRIISAQDEERRRLERNIHDGAQQQLVALAVRIRLAKMLAVSKPEKAQEMLGDLEAETQDALENLRDLARGIYPPPLASQGLEAALSAQARKVTIPLEIRAAGLGRYPKEVEAAVYFSCLEALQNVSKYAHAVSARIEVAATEGELQFSVTDDGVGFDVARTARGSGLTNMQDRLSALGGALAVRSAPGEGTTISGTIPARPVEPAASSDRIEPSVDGREATV